MPITQEQQTILSIGGLGAFIGFCQLLIAREKVTIMYACGRAGMTGVYAMSALALTAVLPSLAVEAKVGLACILGSLGATGTERLFNVLVERRISAASAPLNDSKGN